MAKKALVKIGAGKVAHLATFKSLHRYHQLIDPGYDATTFTHCQVIGKSKVADGEMALCKNCFPYASSPSAAEYRRRHRDIL